MNVQPERVERNMRKYVKSVHTLRKLNGRSMLGKPMLKWWEFNHKLFTIGSQNPALMFKKNTNTKTISTNRPVPGEISGPGGGTCLGSPGGPWAKYIDRCIYIYAYEYKSINYVTYKYIYIYIIPPRLRGGYVCQLLVLNHVCQLCQGMTKYTSPSTICIKNT